jgi:hypothetical protein
MRKFAAFLLLPALLLAGGTKSSRPKQNKSSGLVSTATEAKAIAERDTGGQAVSAHRVPLNGASGGWEVEVRMPKEDRGWRCIIDCDTRNVFTKTRIPNPETSKAKKTRKH